MSTGTRLYHITGIVIRRRNQGEADRVLTLCTPRGKIEVIAKGARKIRSRKAGHVELFSHSNFVIARVEHSWDIVSQVETVRPHARLREDLVRGAQARYVVELLDRFFALGEGDVALFDLLNRTLARLCEEEVALSVRFYEQKLLGLAGFRPELFRCVGEHNVPHPLHPREGDDRRPYGFDPERGGALCRECYAGRPHSRWIEPLSAEGLSLLQDCQRKPYPEVRTRSVSAALNNEVRLLMERYIYYHLERQVGSARFLKQIQAI